MTLNLILNHILKFITKPAFLYYFGFENYYFKKYLYINVFFFILSNKYILILYYYAIGVRDNKVAHKTV